MGYPYNELIAPAVLLNNPGITKEEFVELLDQTHSSSMKYYKSDEDWDFYDPELEDNTYHRGLEGLAYLLGIELSEQARELAKDKIDKFGLSIHAPFFFCLEKEKQLKTGCKYELYIHEENIVEEPKRVRELSWGKLGIGDIWQEVMTGDEEGIVTKIFSETSLIEGINGEEFEGGPEWEYDLEIKPIYGKFKRELIKTDSDLWKRFPFSHPDEKYDWSQKNGFLYSGLMGRQNFLWLNKNSKYYLNKKTFDKIPAGLWINSMRFGYTDLILTSEAIKNNAWKILSYKGLRHFPDFMHSFPESMKTYEKAIWDSHTSLYAKKKGMKTSDLLRMRAVGIE